MEHIRNFGLQIFCKCKGITEPFISENRKTLSSIHSSKRKRFEKSQGVVKKSLYHKAHLAKEKVFRNEYSGVRYCFIIFKS